MSKVQEHKANGKSWHGRNADALISGLFDNPRRKSVVRPFTDAELIRIFRRIRKKSSVNLGKMWLTPPRCMDDGPGKGWIVVQDVATEYFGNVETIIAKTR
jgi:hypothetical protein